MSKSKNPTKNKGSAPVSGALPEADEELVELVSEIFDIKMNTLSPDDEDFVNYVTDPFNQDPDRPGEMVAPPDFYNKPSHLLRLRCSCTFSGGTKTYGYIVGNPYNYSDDHSVTVAYGATDSHAVTLTTKSDSGWTNYSGIQAVLGSTTAYRTVAHGLRVYATSTEDNTAGSLAASTTVYGALNNGAGTFHNSDKLWNPVAEPTQAVAGRGMTTMVPYEVNREMHSTFANSYHPAAGDRYPYEMPVVYFSGLAAGTSLTIEHIQDVQVVFSPKSFLPIVNPRCSLNLGLVADTIGSAPRSASANSFKKIARKLARGVSNIGKFTFKNPKLLAGLAKTAGLVF